MTHRVQYFYLDIQLAPVAELATRFVFAKNGLVKIALCIQSAEIRLKIIRYSNTDGKMRPFHSS